MASIASYSRSSDIPAGAYALSAPDPIVTERVIMELAGSELFGFAAHGSVVASKQSEARAFLWGPEASFYFCFDNIYDEIAVGLRLHCEDLASIPTRVRELLVLVGLERFKSLESTASPMQLSGGEQQRLLVAILVSRRPSFVVGVNPLIYVDHQSREALFELVAKAILGRNGKIVVATAEAELPISVFTKRLEFSQDKYTLFPLDDPCETICSSSELVFPLKPRRAPISDRLLQIENASWQYTNGKVGVSVPFLEFLSDNIYVVCGPNGGGKSSLARLLIAKKLSTHAKVFFKGREITRPFRQLVMKGHISFSFQDPNVHVAGGTVGDYLQAANVDRGIADELHITKYLNEDLLSAAFWIRQAVIFAAAISAQSDIVILDEPLDGTAYEIFGAKAVDLLVEKAGRGASILLITHNPLLAAQVGNNFIWVSNGVAETVPEDRLEGTGAFYDWLGRARVQRSDNRSQS